MVSVNDNGAKGFQKCNFPTICGLEILDDISPFAYQSTM